MAKRIKSIGKKGKGISFAKSAKFDLKMEKGVRTLAPSDDTKTHAIQLVASGVEQKQVAKQIGVEHKLVGRLISAKERKRIGEVEGATILRRSLLENAIVAGEVVREKVGDLGAKDAAVVMGISTSNYLAMRKETEAEQTVVTPHEIASLAKEIAKLTQISQA